MKKEYLWLEFILFFFLFIMPPLFVSTGSVPDASRSVSIMPVLQFSFAVMLSWQFRAETHDDLPAFGKLCAALSWGAISFGSLMLVSAAVQLFAHVLPAVAGTLTEQRIVPPRSVLGWLFLLLRLAAAAFYEEVMYRQYLPSRLLKLAETSSARWPATAWCAEAFAVGIFALSHRYLGWLAVLNAALCGIILRRCFLRTRAVYTGTAAHFLYNALLMVFAAMTQPFPLSCTGDVQENVRECLYYAQKLQIL